MAGKPRLETGDTLAFGRSFLQGPIPGDPVVYSVQLPQVVVPRSLHRLVDVAGDDHLRDATVLGVLHLHPGGTGCHCPALGPPGPRASIGVVPEQWPGTHIGRITSSTTR